MLNTLSYLKNESLTLEYGQLQLKMENAIYLSKVTSEQVVKSTHCHRKALAKHMFILQITLSRSLLKTMASLRMETNSHLLIYRIYLMKKLSHLVQLKVMLKIHLFLKSKISLNCLLIQSKRNSNQLKTALSSYLDMIS